MAVVSVVTPVYNGEAYLAQCIESVLGQSFADWEYVIVDNCSSDRSRRIAERYAGDPRIRIYSNPEVLPVISSFNRAATLVSPDARYLKFVCADDLLFPDCLKLMVEVAESNPTVKLVGAYKIHGQQAVCEGPAFPAQVVPGKDVCRWFFHGKLGILGSQTDHLIRLPTINVAGHVFDRAFLHADTEFYVRLLKDGSDFGFVHQVLTFTRTHESSVSSGHAHVMGTGLLETLAMLVKHGPAFLSEPELRDAVRAVRSAYSRFLFRVALKVWDRRIWRYQVASWAKLGVRIGLPEIAAAGLREAVASAASPRDTVRRLRSEHARVRALKRQPAGGHKVD